MTLAEADAMLTDTERSMYRAIVVASQAENRKEPPQNDWDVFQRKLSDFERANGEKSSEMEKKVLDLRRILASQIHIDTIRRENQSSICYMTYSHLPGVLQVERESFDKPWTEKDLQRCRRRPNFISKVCERNGEVIGFMFCEAKQEKLEILNFAVRPKFRRMKVGTHMVKKIVTTLSCEGRGKIETLLREGNLGAQLFFKAMGFKATEVLRGYYKEDTGEDAFRMQFKLASADNDDVD